MHIRIYTYGRLSTVWAIKYKLIYKHVHNMWLRDVMLGHADEAISLGTLMFPQTTTIYY